MTFGMSCSALLVATVVSLLHTHMALIAVLGTLPSLYVDDLILGHIGLLLWPALQHLDQGFVAEAELGSGVLCGFALEKVSALHTF